MFTINDTQFNLLALKNKELFIIKTGDVLRSEFEEIKDIPDDELYKIISYQISKATHYGFTSNTTITSYIISALVMGENFDTEFSRAKQILKDDLSEEEKIEQIENWITDIFDALDNN